MTIEHKYDLKLQSGKIASWNGTDGVNAAERYVDCHRDAVVIATRRTLIAEVVVLGDRGMQEG